MLVTQRNVESVKQFDKSIAFGISSEDASHLMEVLSDIYKDTTLAVIREYTTNALDSHRDAGQPLPVEIRLPGPLSPEFSVEDFGVGLSIDELEQVYCQYGKSTKRTTNEQTGSIGIGAKAGIAYCGQFSIRARKDGRQVIGIVSCDNQGNPVMDIGLESDTTEPNGVKITIPVESDWRNFKDKVMQFAHFVPKGELTVDGQFTDVSSHVNFINDDFGYIVGHRYDSRHYVVMGGVGYPIDNTKFSGFDFPEPIAFFVPMGSVHFTPAREDLNYTQHTINTLTAYAQTFAEVYAKTVQGTIDAQPSYQEGFKKMVHYRRNLNILGQSGIEFNYKGVQLPSPSRNWNYPIASVVNWNGDRTEKYNFSFSRDDYFTVVITNWNNERFSRTQGRKIDQYLSDNHPTFHADYRKHVCLIDTEVGDFNFVDQFFAEQKYLVIDWDTVKKTKVTTSNSVGKGKARKYPLVSKDTHSGRVYTHDVDPTRTIWYGAKSELSGRGTSDYGYWSEAMAIVGTSDAQFVFVTPTEERKFKESFPTAKKFREYFSWALEDFFSRLSDEDRKAIESNSCTLHNGDMINMKDVLDPRIKEFGNNVLTDTQRKLLEEYQNRGLSRYINKCSMDSQVRKDHVNNVKSYRLTLDTSVKFAEYALLHGTRYSYNGNINSDEVRKAMTDYVNHVYTTQIKEG